MMLVISRTTYLFGDGDIEWLLDLLLSLSLSRSRSRSFSRSRSRSFTSRSRFSLSRSRSFSRFSLSLSLSFSRCRSFSFLLSRSLSLSDSLSRAFSLSLDFLFSVLSSDSSRLFSSFSSSFSVASDFCLLGFFSFDGDLSGDAVLFLSFDLSRERSRDLERRSRDLERFSLDLERRGLLLSLYTTIRNTTTIFALYLGRPRGTTLLIGVPKPEGLCHDDFTDRFIFKINFRELFSRKVHSHYERIRNIRYQKGKSKRHLKAQNTCSGLQVLLAILWDF